MTKNKQLTLIALLVVLFFGCAKDNLKGIYVRPTWLAGKLLTQMQTIPDISTFVELVKKSGYDTIINVSGSFTVFAPNNEAFTQYFQSNLNYKSVAELPKSEAIKLVKYHLVQDAWSKKQLVSLDVHGWIDSLDLKNNLPKGNKRETLYQGKNQLVGVLWSKYNQRFSFGYGSLKRQDVIDTTLTSWHRRIFNDSRKYAPIFYKEYFNIYNLSTSDFDFYFGKPFITSDLYYCGGRIVGDEVFAENGFVYVIDQVVEPLKNGAEFMSDKSKGPDNSYTAFYNLVNKFSELVYNGTETNKQPGADHGLQVDSLFNITYPQLIFNIFSEKTKAPEGTYGLPSNVTIRYHHGIVAPTNKAMNQLINEYIAGANNWKTLTDAPENIKRIIANSSLSINSIYETELLKDGFLNGESDYIKIDPSTIVQKEYGSNCTFIGVDRPIVPRAFSSITGPVYLRPGYSKVMYAIENSGLLSALKRKGANYSFYVTADATTTRDSSFFYNAVLERFTASSIWPSTLATYLLTNQDLQILLLNQVALDQPKNMARKEFIRNLAGNYLIYDKATGLVSGSAPSTVGYKGTVPLAILPRKISTNSDNGTTYEVDGWFNFSIGNVYSYLAANYVKFHSLILKAKLRDDKLGKYTFMSDNQYYTVFAPTDSVMNTITAQTNAMSLTELQNFVMMYFVQGDIIFTDGNKPEGYYATCRINDNSTTVNTKIRIVPGIDQITIPSKNGLLDVVVTESKTSNILMGKSIGTGKEAYTNCVSNGVVHQIKNALQFGNVETK